MRSSTQTPRPTGPEAAAPPPRRAAPPARPAAPRPCSRLLAASLLLLLLVPGCAPNQAQRQAAQAVADYRAGNYTNAVQRLDPLSIKADENFVLNNLRLGSAALAKYDLETAESAFLRAYEVLNSVGVNDGGRTLGAVLLSEGIRVWRGEPFERAMANFYLGLVYYMRGDYANARGAFENALFKLRDYGEQKGKDDQYRETESNFALGYVMLGRAYQRLGRDDLAQNNYERAVALRPDLADVADFERNKRSNLLLVIDFGYGPHKVTTGGGSIAGFSPSPAQEGPLPPPVVRIDGEPVDLNGLDRPPVDLLALAQDRRWQSLDTIRAVKSAIGTGLMVGGMVYGMQHDSRPEIVLGTFLGGLLLKATSQADVRQWEMLPRTVYVLPLQVPPGTHDVGVEFPQVPGVRQEWRGLVAPAEGEATYYFRMQRGNPGPFQWPPLGFAGPAPSSAPTAERSQ